MNGEKHMKLFIYRYGSICEPDIIDTFKRMGAEVDELNLSLSQPDITDSKRVEILSQQFLNNSYDFIFTINFFPWLSQLCNILKLPYISVIVDSPVLELFDNTLGNPCNRIFLFDKMLYNDFAPKNPDCIFYIPLAANVVRTDNLLSMTAPDVKEHFRSDISFVGSTYQEKCIYNKINLPAFEKGFADGLIEAQLKIYGYNFIEDIISDDFVKKVIEAATNSSFEENELPMYRAIVAQHILSVKVAEQERLRLLPVLSERFNVDFYTGSDTSSMPHINNRGLAASQEEMPVIFNQSKINLNITAKSIRSGLPLRIFDVLGCGGFLITNYQAELSDYFTIGEDLVAYESFEDLLDKCAYYLEHEEERKKIAQNGYQTVKNLHTWDIRLKQILEIALK
jgi:spore maturation protein CgeB